MTDLPTTAGLHTLTGRCACGAVSFSAKVTKTYGVCHCHTCRRWAGGMWFGVTAPLDTKIDGPLKIWASSKHADRGYCAECGSSIFHRVPKMEHLVLGQGLFDDQTGWKMVRQVFDDERPDHYEFGTGAPAFTGKAAIMAFLAGKLPK